MRQMAQGATVLEVGSRTRLDRLDLSALTAIVAYGALATWLSRGAMPDDALIYARVTENVLAGYGLQYNHGDPTNPVTSMLYTAVLLVAGLATPGDRAVLIAFGAGLCAFGAVLYLAGVDQGRGFSIVTALLCCSHPLLLQSVGLETSVFLAVVFGAALAHQRRRYVLTGGLAGLAVFARPEGAAVSVVIALLEWLRTRRLPRAFVVSFAVVLSFGLAVLWKLQGGFVPHAVNAKALQSHADWFGRHGSWLGTFLQYGVFYGLSRYWQVNVMLALSPIVLLPLIIQGVREAVAAARRGTSFVLVVLLFGAVQVASYTALRAPAGYPWYAAPGGVALTLVALLGARYYLDRAEYQSQQPRSGAAGGRIILARLLLAVARLGRVTKSPLTAWVFAGFLAFVIYWSITPYRLSDEYMEVARRLQTTASPGATVACNEIGYIGYYSRLNVVDMLGLAHRDALPYLAHGRMDWWLDRRASFVVVHASPSVGEPSSSWPDAALERFKRDYVPLFATRSLLVFRREPVF